MTLDEAARKFAEEYGINYRKGHGAVGINAPENHIVALIYKKSPYKLCDLPLQYEGYSIRYLMNVGKAVA